MCPKILRDIPDACGALVGQVKQVKGRWVFPVMFRRIETNTVIEFDQVAYVRFTEEYLEELGYDVKCQLVGYQWDEKLIESIMKQIAE